MTVGGLRPAPACEEPTAELDLELLERTALQVRLDVLDMVGHARSGHIGASYSIVEILVAIYMGVRPSAGEMKVILSKGHGAPALYAVLRAAGLLPETLDWAREFRKVDGLLQGHPCRRTPGVDLSTGSLGMGLSAGLGMALGTRILGTPSPVFVVLGDGELNEGQVWEAAMAASHFKAGNLIAIVDRNGIQCSGLSDEVMSMPDLAGRWRSFGWRLIETDGHDFGELHRALAEALAARHAEKPTVLLASTDKHHGLPSQKNTLELYGEKLAAADLQSLRAELLRGDQRHRGLT